MLSPRLANFAKDALQVAWSTSSFELSVGRKFVVGFEKQLGLESSCFSPPTDRGLSGQGKSLLVDCVGPDEEARVLELVKKVQVFERSCLKWK